jgi:hypothetical protein
MIFRRLYRRKMLRAFGPFVDASGIALLEKAAAETTEWQAFKSFLPLRLFHSEGEINTALSELARLARHYSRGPTDDQNSN